MSLIQNRKPRGAPFQKGHDPRRNLEGGSSPKAKQDFKAEFRRIFEDEATPGRLRKIVRVLFRKAELGQPWAISEVLNRALGKPAQMIESPRGAGHDLEFGFIEVVYTATDKDGRRQPGGLGAAPGARPLAGPEPVGILDAHAEATPADRPAAELTDDELEAEIARLEAEEGKDEVKAA